MHKCGLLNKLLTYLPDPAIWTDDSFPAQLMAMKKQCLKDLTPAQQDVLTRAGRIPMQLCWASTPLSLADYRYNQNKAREEWKKVGEEETVAECLLAAQTALELGSKLVSNPVQNIRELQIISVIKVIAATVLPGFMLRMILIIMIDDSQIVMLINRPLRSTESIKLM